NSPSTRSVSAPQERVLQLPGQNARLVALRGGVSVENRAPLQDRNSVDPPSRPLLEDHAVDVPERQRPTGQEHEASKPRDREDPAPVPRPQTGDDEKHAKKPHSCHEILVATPSFAPRTLSSHPASIRPIAERSPDKVRKIPE